MDIKEFLDKKEIVQGLINDTQVWAEQGNKHFTHDENYNFDELLNRLDCEDVFVAILGRQGAGKSTIGNILLDGKNVFPMDVEETTNVLTMVTGIPEDKKEYAQVRFEDKEPVTGDLNAEFLEPYVADIEGYNLNNHKKVTEVRCYAHVRWLEQSGTWLVDTPGVNSLREYNHELTMNFLPNITVGIFLCSVNPPIQNDEKMFLDAIWNQRPLMHFVQNRWEEPISDVRQAEEWNLNVIKELTQINDTVAHITEEKIYTVNVAKGFSAYLEEDPEEELEDCGASELLNDLSTTLTDKLKTIRLASSLNQLTNIVNQKIKGLNDLHDKIGLNIVVEDKKFNEDKDQKQKAYDQCKNNISKISQLFQQEIRKFYQDAIHQINDKAKEAKEDLLLLIDSSSMSPEYFQEQFKVTVKRYFDPPIDTFELANILDNYIRSTADEIESLSKQLDSITQDTLVDTIKNEGANQQYIDVKPVESEDFLKAIAYILDAVGVIRTSLIGLAVGTAIFEATTIVEAIVAAGGAMAAVPVIGWVIAGSCLIAGVLARNLAKKKEKEAMRSAAIESLNKTCLQIKSSIEESANAIPAKLKEAEKEIQKRAKEIFDNSINAVEKLQRPIEEQKQTGIEIEKLIKTGEDIQNRCNGGVLL